MKKLTGTRVALEGIERFPTSSALLACNSTHKMDWFFFQELFMNLGLRAPIISKGKNWHEPTARFGCHFLDALPMVSKGYILGVDLKDVLGERPDEALYRRVRAYVDHDEDPGDDPVIRRILGERRNVLGAQFSPSHTTYRQFVRELYYRFQQEHLLRMCRDMIHQNHHIHIYPQGTVSSRLSRGRIGVIELSKALNIPIIPLGLSGAPKVFMNESLPILKGGDVTIRIGEPMYVDDLDVPNDFKPFYPDHEELYREPLQSAADDLMERINVLLDPPYQWAPDRESDGKQGVKRFI